MRNKENKHLGLEITPELHFKLHYISKYEDRSANGQIMFLLRKCIKEFEEEHGVISLPDDFKKKEVNYQVCFFFII